MKTILTSSGQIGKFEAADIQTLSDRYIAGGCVYMFDMLGTHSIVDYIEPPIAPIVPESVSMRQARLALLQSGMLSAVNAVVAGMAGAAGDAARIEWEFSNEVQRHKPLVESLAPALGLTSSQLDQLFILANKL